MDSSTQLEAKNSFASKTKEIATFVAIAFALISYLGFVGNSFSITTADDTKSFFSLAEVLTNFSNLSCYLAWASVSLPILAVVAILLGKFVFKNNKNWIFGAALLMAISSILLFLPRSIYADNMKATESEFTVWGAWMPAFMALSAFTLLFSTASEDQYTIADICECGMLIAMAFVLNLIKFKATSDGGSLNFQMIPLFILALRRGPIKGFIACGIVYGLLTCLTDGYGLATFPFDYLIGFGSTCILGFVSKFVFSEKRKFYDLFGVLAIVLAGIGATLIRLLGSTISSMVLYDYSFMDGIIYNATYIPLQGLFALVFLVAIYGPLQRLNKLYPVR